MTNLNIGIAGLGTVGGGVIKILEKQSGLIEKRCGKKITVKAISARNKNKDRGINTDGIKWYENAVDLASDKDIDVVVELIGGDSGAAYELCKKSLEAGKDFVTANKAMIAKHGVHLAELAEKNNVKLMFEAAVAGGIPVIKALKEGLAANEITRVSGILNGTCNYMLTAMQETGRDFDVILKEAQDLGYAEADPGFDIDGIDAAHKLAILSSIAFAAPVSFDKVYIEGIRKISLLDINYAEELGYKIKLLGICSLSQNGIEQRVTPCLIAKTHPLAKVSGVNNAVFIEGSPVGRIMLEGPGAGEGATASAVMSDIIDIAQGRSSYTFNQPVKTLKSKDVIDMSRREGEYYIRVTVQDKSGVLAAITDIFRDEGISIESILQKPVPKGNNVHIVGITHEMIEEKMRKAVEKIEKIDSVIGKTSIIRVE